MYNRMLCLLVFSFVCLISLSPNRINAAETDIEKKLLEEMVEIEDGKMKSTEFGLLSFPKLSGVTIRFKVYAEAPADGVISRDNFVALTTATQAMILFEIAVEAYSEAGVSYAEFMKNPSEILDIDELDGPIGSVDLEISFYMNQGGLQIEVADTYSGGTERHKMTWAEVFE